MTMPLSHPLREASLETVLRCGGKAARLGEALSLGCPVPEGQVLSTDLYRRFLRQGGLQGEISSILSIMQPSAMAHFQAAEWAIREAFRARRLPEDVVEEIRGALRALGEGPVAVRSSATNEGSPQQSFVGQHATFLSVRSEQDVVNSVIECWMSLFSAKALSYAHHFQIDLLNSAMAVLLEVEVYPTERGVLFTVDPVTGNPDRFVMELPNDTGFSQYRLDPYRDEPEHPASWHQLRRMGLLLDERLQSYQALEWGIADGQLSLLCVRPVTGASPYLPLSADRIAAIGGLLELEHSGGVRPRALAPLSRFHRSRIPRLRAAYSQRSTRLFQPHPRGEGRVLYGYLYCVAPRTAPNASATPGTLTWWGLAVQRLWAARTLDHEFRELLHAARPRLEELSSKDLATLTDSALCTHLAEVMALHEAFEEQRGRLGESDTLLTGILEHLQRAWVRDAVDTSKLLLSGDDPLSARDAALCRLARTNYSREDEREQAFGAFFHRYRHLFLDDGALGYTTDIVTLRPDERAARVALHQAETSAPPGAPSGPGAKGGEDDACDQRGRRRSERETAERETLAQLGAMRRRIYQQVLHLAQRYAPLGIEKDEPVLLCSLLERDVLWEVSRRLRLAGLAEDEAGAGLLSARELSAFLVGELPTEDVRQILSRRKASLRRWRRYAPPKVLDAAAMLEQAARDASSTAGERLRGLAVSRGYSEGRARVATSASEASSVVPGEILVCRKVHYDLSPWLGIVSAVVAETGGLLDDSAVLAREYRVPAIFAVPQATERLRTGDSLVVDATHGLVIQRREEPAWDLFP